MNNQFCLYQHLFATIVFVQNAFKNLSKYSLFNVVCANLLTVARESSKNFDLNDSPR